jgi:uncharacterized protein YbjT (DUF2867 family)
LKYFVTGATGFVDGVVVRQLISNRHQVNAIVRDPSKATELKILGAQLFPGDITEKKPCTQR